MSHTYNQYGFPSSPFHIQLNTSNTNNIYSVDIIADPNVLGSTIDSPQLTPSGIPFYTAEITPNDYTQLLCAGNFKIDGISSSWVYNADYSNYSYHPNPCYPVNPPWYGTGADQQVIYVGVLIAQQEVILLATEHIETTGLLFLTTQLIVTVIF